MSSFKMGDFVFCEFKLQEIKAITNGHVTEVSDGCIRMSGSDYKCFPISLQIKQISEHFKYIHDQLLALNNSALNYPDFNRYLIKKWIEACNEIDAYKVTVIITKTNEWYNSIKNHLRKNVEFDGVRLFR